MKRNYALLPKSEKTCVAMRGAGKGMCAVLAASALVPAIAFANPQIVAFNSDATCGVSSDLTYTHAVDFGTVGGNPVVEGVTFFCTTAATLSAAEAPLGYGWSGFPSEGHGGGSMNVMSTQPGQEIRAVLTDMNYNLANGTMRLTDLKPGFEYEVRLFNRVWGGGGNDRWQTFTFKPDSATADEISFNQDDTVVKDNALVYRYRVGEDGTLAIDVKARNSGSTFHCYGFVNAELSGNFAVTGIDRLTGTEALLDAAIFFADSATTIEAHWGETGGELTDSVTIGTYSGNDTFTVALGDLTPSTEYRVLLKAVSDGTDVWSAPFTFTTRGTIPVISAAAATNVDGTTATLNGRLDYLGGAQSATVTVLWSTDAEFSDPSSATISDVAEFAAVAHPATGLIYDTVYYFKLVADNGIDTAESETVSFQTIGKPRLGEISATASGTSATMSAEIESAGPSTATTTVTCWFGPLGSDFTKVATWQSPANGDIVEYVFTSMQTGVGYRYVFDIDCVAIDGMEWHIRSTTNYVGTAGNCTWTGGAMFNTDWNTPANWTPGVPGPAATALFNTDVTVTAAQALSPIAALQIGTARTVKLDFADGAPLTLTGRINLLANARLEALNGTHIATTGELALGDNVGGGMSLAVSNGAHVVAGTAFYRGTSNFDVSVGGADAQGNPAQWTIARLEPRNYSANNNCITIGTDGIWTVLGGFTLGYTWNSAPGENNRIVIKDGGYASIGGNSIVGNTGYSNCLWIGGTHPETDTPATFDANGFACFIGYNGSSSNNMIVVDAGGAFLNANIIVGETVTGAGVGYPFHSKLIVQNGGYLHGNAQLGNRRYSHSYYRLLGTDSLHDANGNTLDVSAVEHGEVFIDSGSITNLNQVRIGYAQQGQGGITRNRLDIFNGGRVHSIGEVSIGRTESYDNLYACDNHAVVSGQDTVWNMNGAALRICHLNRSKTYGTNNTFTVRDNGIVTNINAVTVGGHAVNAVAVSNELVLAGGSLYANTLTVYGTNGLGIAVSDNVKPAEFTGNVTFHENTYVRPFYESRDAYRARPPQGRVTLIKTRGTLTTNNLALVPNVDDPTLYKLIEGTDDDGCAILEFKWHSPGTVLFVR